jgi:hypothetical protein
MIEVEQMMEESGLEGVNIKLTPATPGLLEELKLAQAPEKIVRLAEDILSSEGQQCHSMDVSVEEYQVGIWYDLKRLNILSPRLNRPIGRGGEREPAQDDASLV